ncbi:MAG: class A beta-lactamase-related serine hydrolase [Pedosphaera sp.]|nr:class A beta-lactamase-related serine hydrolase [Pedosphaera sp.]
MKRTFSRAVICGLLLVANPLLAQLPHAQPDELGFSPERLGKLQAMVQGYIDEGKHAGAITIIARDGRIVDFKTYGYRDLEARAPMEKDTIVRIYSMSKVITSVAVLQLFEEGRFSLDDPVSRFLPQLTNLKVCTGGTAENATLVDAKRPITIKHLLTHTAGFAYDFTASEPVKTLFQKADILESSSLKEFVERLSKLPLVQEPGTAFYYGVNTDVLGALVEVVSGKPLEDYMQDRIFGPLGMKDTGFDVLPEKMPRLAKLYENGPDGKLRAAAKPPYGTYSEKGRGFASGGGGLFSTAGDYLRFAQMLLNGGKLDGHQILGRKTVELMTANHLTFLEKPTLGENGAEGFGLGGSVRIDLAKANTLGSVGVFGCDGAATTTFRIDPKEKTAVLLLTQHLPYNQHGIFAKFYTLFYQSLVD